MQFIYMNNSMMWSQFWLVFHMEDSSLPKPTVMTVMAEY
jgi:hypothetical protein